MGDAHFIDTMWNFLEQVWPVPCASLQSSKTLLPHQIFRTHLKHEQGHCALKVREGKAEMCPLSQVPKVMQEGRESLFPSSPHQETVEILASKRWTTPL